MRIAWGVGVVVIAGIALASAACGRGSKATQRAIELGMQASERAAAASIPGAKEGTMRANSHLGWGGGQAHGGSDQVFGTYVARARFDWSGLVETAPLGIAGLVVAQADEHARLLRDAGFVPLATGADTLDSQGRSAEFQVAVATSATGSAGAKSWWAPRDVDRLVHHRIYHAPGTGAFVLARIEYDGHDHSAAVELTYVESTVDAEYPALKTTFSETVSAAPKKR
jgi:hypothetical protein